MKTNKHVHASILAVTITALVLTGCSSVSPAKTEPDKSVLSEKVLLRIRPLIETLYINNKELLETYRDLRAIARGHLLQGDDEQLNYVQKATAHIQKAHISAMHQWEFLSIMEYIRSAAMIDYYTLRHKGLEHALHEALYDERFIIVYRAYIDNATAQKDIDSALAIIKSNCDIYRQLLTAIAPLVRKPGPTEVL